MKLEHTLTIALTKGRILRETLPLLAEVGIAPREDLESSRKLIVATTVPNISLVILRGSDVPTYVRHGAAEDDVLLEQRRGVLTLGLRQRQPRRVEGALHQPRDRVWRWEGRPRRVQGAVCGRRDRQL